MKLFSEMSEAERELNIMTYTDLYRLITQNHPLKEFAEEVIKTRLILENENITRNKSYGERDLTEI